MEVCIGPGHSCLFFFSFMDEILQKEQVELCALQHQSNVHSLGAGISAILFIGMFPVPTKCTCSKQVLNNLREEIGFNQVKKKDV